MSEPTQEQLGQRAAMWLVVAMVLFFIFVCFVGLAVAS